MDSSEKLKNMMSVRINALLREAAKLARTATFSSCPNERRWLRDESKTMKSKAAMLQARIAKLDTIAPVTVKKDVLNG